MTHRQRYISYLILVFAIAFAFGNSTRFDFAALDDAEHILKNPDVFPLSSEGLERIWEKPHAGLYIPLTYSLWSALGSLAAQTSPPSPAVFHSGNLVVHGLNAFLVLEFLFLCLGNVPAALAGATLFAIHPVQTEPVVWISGMKDLLSSFFALLSFVLFQYGMRLRKRTLFTFSFLALIFAWLSKPTTVVLPISIGALLYLSGKQSLKSTVKKLVPWILCALPFALFCFRLQSGERLFFKPEPIWTRPLVALDAVVFYLGKLFWPHPLAIDYARSPHWLLHSGILPVTLGIGVIGTVLLLFGPWRRRSELHFSFLFFLVPLLPVLGIIPFFYQAASTVADRYLYLSLLGPALALGFLVRHWLPRKSEATAYATCLLLLLFCARSRAQTQIWNSNDSLFANVLRYYPQSWRANDALGLQAVGRGDLEMAVHHFQTAARLRPRAVILSNLGGVLVHLGRITEAEAAFSQAIEQEPHFAPAHYNLGVLYLKRGERERARLSLKRAQELDPQNPGADAILRDLASSPPSH